MNPSFEPPNRFIPFSRPSIGTEEEAAVIDVLRSGWLTTAERTLRFEDEFATFVGAKHAIALCSGTAGLHLALEAIGIRPGDRVVTTPYTFTATAEVIRYLGADPLFVDIEPDSYNIDPERVAEALGDERVKAVIPVHLGGDICRIERLLELTGKRGIPIIEDSAHAFPSRTDWGYAGTAGVAGMYSFYANKTITTGEGGMIVTDDDELAKRIRVMRLHGIDRTIWDRYTQTEVVPEARSWEYDVVAPGFKYNMPDTAAAIGLVQLKRAEELLENRRTIALRYIENLQDCDFLECPRDTRGHAWHLFLILLKLETLEIGRDQFIDALTERGIGTSVHYKPLHLMSYYRDRYSLLPESYPNAIARYSRVISLPIYPGLSIGDTDTIVAAIREIGDGARTGR